MKKTNLFIAILLGCLSAAPGQAQNMSYIEEVRALGAVSGQGLACGSSKYETFEMLARAILISKASSDREQARAMQVYNEEKANAYVSKQMDGFFECAQINRRFDAQDIFNAKLYADGTIQMPDGSIITPRAPYDASLVYDAEIDEHAKAEAIYNKKKRKNQEAPKINAGVTGEATSRAYTPPPPADLYTDTDISDENSTASTQQLPASAVGHIRRSY